jgi:hypothetical protein
MPKFIDLTGKKFGRLTVVCLSERSKHGINYWECHCSCGNTKISKLGDLRSGRINSCGCLRKEITKQLNKSHGKSKTAEYRTWKNMIGRCTNPSRPDFKYYGERGIEVYVGWVESFSAFYEHIGQKPTPKHSIDRIDNNLGYIPGNVRWATQTEQTNNCRSNHYVTYCGETKTLAQWAKYLGVTMHMIRNRIKRGWSIEKALTEPFQYHYIRSVTFEGKTQSVTQWADDYGIKRGTLSARLNKGWSMEKALNKQLNID